MELLKSGKIFIIDEKRLLGPDKCEVINNKCPNNYNMVCHYHNAKISNTSVLNKKSPSNSQIVTFHPEHIDYCWEWNFNKEPNGDKWQVTFKYNRKGKILDSCLITDKDYSAFMDIIGQFIK